MNERIVELERVTLRRRMQEEFSYDLKRTLFSIIERRWRVPSRRTVIDDVSLAIERGEKLGLIGPNGSGKSTLLKLIAGILRPTSGTVRTQGTIAPLIELGAGFDSDLSVEDNILYYGVFLGRSRARMREIVPRILEFAELGDYRRVPLKALSSGMAARLGFAVATEVDPDILLLDEVFAVGDEAFRQKSAMRLRQLWGGARAVVLVSHNLESVTEQCGRAVWLDHGSVRAIGDAGEIVERYASSVAATARLAAAERLSSAHAFGMVDLLQHDPESATLAMYGWALVSGGERTGTTVGVFIDGRFLQEAAYGDPRPDVAETLQRETVLRCGFHGSFSLAALEPGRHEVVAALFDHVTHAFHPFGDTSEIVVRAPQDEAERRSRVVTAGH